MIPFNLNYSKAIWIRKKDLLQEKLKRVNVTNDLWKIWLKVDEKFSFDPGQYYAVGYEGIERPYSIASSPDEDLVELFIELVPEPDGILTPILL